MRKSLQREQVEPVEPALGVLEVRFLSMTLPVLYMKGHSKVAAVDADCKRVGFLRKCVQPASHPEVAYMVVGPGSVLVGTSYVLVAEVDLIVFEIVAELGPAAVGLVA